MPTSTILSDNGVTSGTNGLKTAGGDDGTLILQTTTAGGTATTAMTINTTQQVAFTAGTAAAPSITPSGDPNTGIFFPAADTIAFSEGGTESMRIDSSGRLGIGTTVIGAKLSVTNNSDTDYTATDFCTSPSAVITNTTSGALNYTSLLFSTESNGEFAIGSVQNSGNTASDFVFASRASGSRVERARIDSSGNLLVGTTSAVASATRAGFYNAGSASAVVGVQNARNVSGDVVNVWQIGSNANNTSSYFLQCGVVGVANVLYIFGNGNIQNTNNSYGAISDVKLKENIVDATPKLADLMQVRVRNYNLKTNPDQKQIGVIAQELENIFPSLIDESPDKDSEGNELGTTTKAVKYSVFVPMLIKATQELKAELDTVKAQNAAFEARLAALEVK